VLPIKSNSMNSGELNWFESAEKSTIEKKKREMALNPQLYPNGMAVPFENELFVLARDGVEFEVDKIPGFVFCFSFFTHKCSPILFYFIFYFFWNLNEVYFLKGNYEWSLLVLMGYPTLCCCCRCEKVKAKGTIYLSNIRMVFVASQPVGNFYAFDMPLVSNRWIFILVLNRLCNSSDSLFLEPFHLVGWVFFPFLVLL
jgi:hypothetical protein